MCASCSARHIYQSRFQWVSFMVREKLGELPLALALSLLTPAAVFGGALRMQPPPAHQWQPNAGPHTALLTSSLPLLLPVPQTLTKTALRVLQVIGGSWSTAHDLYQSSAASRTDAVPARVHVPCRQHEHYGMSSCHLAPHAQLATLPVHHPAGAASSNEHGAFYPVGGAPHSPTAAA